MNPIFDLLWSEALPDDAVGPWINQFGRTVMWWGLVGFAVLDVSYPLAALNGIWWCVFFLLWMTPWRPPVCSRASYAKLLALISTWFLFSWLIYRTQIAASDSLRTWYILKSSPWLTVLSFPVRAALAAVATAALTVIPLRKIAGERATSLAVIASLPYAVSVAEHTFLVPSHWAQQTLAQLIYLVDALMPAIVIGGASSVLERVSFRAGKYRFYVRFRTYVVAVLLGKLNAAIALFVLYGGSLALVIWVFTKSKQGSADSVSTAIIFAILGPAATGLLALASVATWRSLARAGEAHIVVDNLATIGRLVLGTSALGIAFLVFFELPDSFVSLTQAIEGLPGPAWLIKPTVVPGGLRISGELQRGVSRAFANALAGNETIHRVELDSPGGDVGEGFALADLVAQHSLATVVNARCASACTIAFVAGQERMLGPHGKLGFHRLRSLTWYDAFFTDDVGNDKLAKYFRSKGVNADFALKAVRVPSQSIWYPTAQELLAAGVISNPAVRHPDSGSLRQSPARNRSRESHAQIHVLSIAAGE